MLAVPISWFKYILADKSDLGVKRTEELLLFLAYGHNFGVGETKFWVPIILIISTEFRLTVQFTCLSPKLQKQQWHWLHCKTMTETKKSICGSSLQSKNHCSCLDLSWVCWTISVYDTSTDKVYKLTCRYESMNPPHYLILTTDVQDWCIGLQ